MDLKSATTDKSELNDSFVVLREHSDDEVPEDATASVSEVRFNLNRDDDKTQALGETFNSLSSSIVVISHEDCKISEYYCHSCNKSDGIVTNDANISDESLLKVDESVPNKGSTNKHELGEKATTDQCAQDEHQERPPQKTVSSCNVDKRDSISPGEEDEEEICGNVDINDHKKEAEQFTENDEKAYDYCRDQDNIACNKLADKTYSASSDRQPDINRNEEFKETLIKTNSIRDKDDKKDIPTDVAATDDTKAKEAIHSNMNVNNSKEDAKYSFPSLKHIEMKSTKGNADCEEDCEHEWPLIEEKSISFTVDTSHTSNDTSNGNSSPELISTNEFGKEEKPSTLPDDLLPINHNENQRTDEATTHVIEDKTVVDKLKPVVTNGHDEMTDSTIQTNAPPSHATTGFVKPEIVAPIAAKTTVSVASDADLESQSNQYTSTAGTNTAKHPKEEDTKHVQTMPDSSSKNEKSEFEKEDKASTLPDDLLPINHNENQRIDEATTHVIEDKTVVDKLKPVVTNGHDEMTDSTIQTNAPPSHATTGFVKPEIAAPIAAKNTVSVASDADLESQSNQYTSIAGTNTAKHLKEEDTKHVQTMPDSSSKNEKNEFEKEDKPSTRPDDLLPINHNENQRIDEATTHVIEDKTVVDKLKPVVTNGHDEMTDSTIQTNAPPSHATTGFVKPEIVAPIAAKTTVSVASDADLESQSNQYTSTAGTNTAKHPKEEDTKHVQTMPDSSSKNEKSEFEKEDKASTLPDDLLPINHNENQRIDEATTHVIEDKTVVDKLKPVVTNGHDEMTDSTIQTNAPPSHATTGFVKPEIAAPIAAKNTVSVASDADLESQSNQYTSIAGTNTAKHLKEEDTKHVQTMPDSSSKNEKNEFEKEDKPSTRPDDLLPINHNENQRIDEATTHVIEDKTVVDKLKPVVTNGHDEITDSTIQTNAPPSHATTGFVKPEIAAPIAAKSTVSVASDADLESQSNQYTSIAGTNTAKHPKEEDTKHVQTMPDSSSKNEKNEFEKEDKPSTLPDDLLPINHNENQRIDEATTHVIDDKTVVDKLKPVVTNGHDEMTDSTIQTNAPTSHATTGFVKPEIAAPIAAKTTASVASDADLESQSNQYTSTAGTNTAKHLKEEDTKHVQTMPDSSSKNEKSSERTVKKCMAVKCIFGDVKLIKVGPLYIMDINGMKTKLPQSINRDDDLRLEKLDEGVAVLTEKVCFEVKLVGERIVLNNITSRVFAKPARALRPVEKEHIVSEDIDDNEQQRRTRIGPYENTASRDIDGFDNERASVYSQNVDSTVAPKSTDLTVDLASSSAKPKEVVAVDKPTRDIDDEDQLSQEDSAFKKTLTDDVVKGRANANDPNNIFDKASPKLQTVTSETSCTSTMNAKDDLLSQHKSDSDERPVNVKSRPYNEKGNDEDNEGSCLPRKEDTQHTFDERAQILLQTDEFDKAKLRKDQDVAENQNAPKDLSNSNTEKTDVGTEMTCKKRMAVSCNFGEVKLIKVGPLYIMDINGTKSKLPKSVNQDTDLRLEKREDSVFLLTGSVCFEVKFKNERIQLTNISSMFFSNSTVPTLQAETKTLDRHSNDNTNQSQGKMISSSESLGFSNSSVHDNEIAKNPTETLTIGGNDSKESESTDKDVNYSTTKDVQVGKQDLAKARERETGCNRVGHSDHNELMSNAERYPGPMENDDQQSVQRIRDLNYLTDIAGERLEGEKRSKKQNFNETYAFQDSFNNAVKDGAVHSEDTSGPFNVRERKEDICGLHGRDQVSSTRVGNDMSDKSKHETSIRKADSGICSNSKADLIEGDTEKCHAHEEMMKTEEIYKRKQTEDQDQHKTNRVEENEEDELVSHMFALSIDDTRSGKPQVQERKEIEPHTEIHKEVRSAIRYPSNPGESNNLKNSETTYTVSSKVTLPRVEEKQVEHAFQVCFRIENETAETKTFTITSSHDNYMKWNFFINSPELRGNLSKLTIDRNVLDIHIGPEIFEIVTPLENNIEVSKVCQRLTEEVLKYCSHIVVKDITQYNIPSTIDRMKSSVLFKKKCIYFETMRNGIIIAYGKCHECDVFKMIQGKVDSGYGNEPKSDKSKNAPRVKYQVDLPSHLPWKKVFERFSLAKKLEHMFPSLHLQIKRNAYGVYIHLEGEEEDASEAKSYLLKDFVDTIHRREVKIPLVGSEVFVITNLCGLINKALGTDALLMIENSKPILYSLDKDLLEKAITHICTKCIESKDILLVNSWRDEDAIAYLVDTYTQLKNGVLIQVKKERTHLLVTGWKLKVTEVVQEIRKVQKSQFQTLLKEEGLVKREKIVKIRLRYELRNGQLWMALFDKFKICDHLKECSESKDIDIQTEVRQRGTGQETLHLMIEGRGNDAERTMKIFQDEFEKSFCMEEVNLRIEMHEILKKTDAKRYLERMFPKVLVVQRDNRFILYGFERDTCETSANKMNKMYAEDRVAFDTRLKEEALTDILIRYSTAPDGISVLYDEDGLAIKIAGFKDDVRRITNEITRYIQQAMDSTTVHIEQDEAFELLQSDLKFLDHLKGEYEVEITQVSEKNCFIINGTRSSVEACKKAIEDYVSKVSSEYYETDELQNKIFVKGFDHTMDSIRDQKTVLVDISVTFQSGFEYMDKTRGRKEWRFPGNHKVLLLNQDEGGADPFYVVRVGETPNSNGSWKREEVVGNQCFLRMKQPSYNQTNSSSVQRTKELIKAILKFANENREEAIMFQIPMLASWSFESLMECWMTAFKEHYMDSESSGSLKFILLSGEGDVFYKCLQPFKIGLLGFTGESITPTKNTRGIKITLKRGKLNETKADVLVNTASPDLNLKKGAVSGSLLQTAGSQLQSEIEHRYPTGIRPSELAVTGGFKLQCKYVFHGALRVYDQRDQDKLLLEFRQFILTCLSTAIKQGAKTIAFPAIGTGNLRYPLGTVVDEMYKTVNNYKADNPRTKLEEVLFVVFDGDHVACEAFEKRQKLEDINQTPSLRGDTRASRQETPVKTRINITGLRDNTAKAMTMLQKQLSNKDMRRKELPEHRNPTTYAAAVKKPTFGSNPSAKMIGEIPVPNMRDALWCIADEGLVVKVYQADLLNLTVDCIVNPANNTLDHSGGLANVIAKEAGRTMIDACNTHVRKYGPVKVGTALSTISGKLSCYKCVIHAVGPNWVDYSPHYAENIMACRNDLKDAILSSLRVAETNRMTTIAFPAVSSGIYCVPRDICVMEYINAVKDFSTTSSRQSRTLKEVHFVDRNPDMVGLMKKGFTRALIDKQPFSWDWKVYINREPARANNTSNATTNQNSEFSSLPYFVDNGNTLTCKLAQARCVAVSGEDMFSFKGSDVIVCSEDQSGSAQGGVAKSLLKTGGQQYQKEKMKVYQQSKPKIGELLITGGGTTGYKAVYHAIMPHRMHFKDEGSWTRALGEMINKIFDMADKYGHKTMVMSLLGTGAGKSDPKQCAQVLFDCVSRSCMRYSDSPFFLNIVNIDPALVRIVSEVFKASITESKKLLAGPAPSEPGAQRSKQHSVPQTGGNPGVKPKVRRHNDDYKCSICLDGIRDPRTIQCGHTFCKRCIDEQFKEKPLCPICNAVCGVYKGNQPDGVMTIEKVYTPLPGYGTPTIRITYDIIGGVQGKRHPSPGKPFFGVTRVAYLPYNPNGLEVCALLKLAFERRLVFTIGESRTTQTDGVVTWNGIHHKTTTARNAEFGYPDPGYFKRVKGELAAKGVLVTDKDFDKDIEKKLDMYPKIVMPMKYYQAIETRV